ncbi:hypothetical protein [Azospirillum sp. sgz302134]
MAYVFAALVGLASLAFALVLATRQLRTAEERIANAVARKDAQVDRLRRAARGTLHQARELRDMRRRKTSIEFACEDLEQRLKASNAVDRRIYVLDDRHTPADLGWVVKVANPDYARRVNDKLDKDALERWKRGRRFLVWGLDEKKAREKINARHPESKGFTILSVQQHLD